MPTRLLTIVWVENCAAEQILRIESTLGILLTCSLSSSDFSIRSALASPGSLVVWLMIMRDLDSVSYTGNLMLM